MASRAKVAERGARSGAGRSVRVPQQARSRRTRERVLGAAVDCFEQHGFDATTTAMIAARARIGVGTLYGYFRDKREILFELLERTMADVGDLVLSRLDPESLEGRDVREHVRQLIDALFHLQTVQPGIQRALWASYFRDPDFHEPVEALRERLREAVVRFGRSLAERGLPLRPGLDLATAAAVVVNAVQWNALHSHMHGTPEQIDQAAAATAEMISAYLFCD